MIDAFAFKLHERADPNVVCQHKVLLRPFLLKKKIKYLNCTLRREDRRISTEPTNLVSNCVCNLNQCACSVLPKWNWNYIRAHWYTTNKTPYVLRYMECTHTIRGVWLPFACIYDGINDTLAHSFSLSRHSVWARSRSLSLSFILFTLRSVIRHFICFVTLFCFFFLSVYHRAFDGSYYCYFETTTRHAQTHTRRNQKLNNNNSISHTVNIVIVVVVNIWYATSSSSRNEPQPLLRLLNFCQIDWVSERAYSFEHSCHAYSNTIAHLALIEFVHFKKCSPRWQQQLYIFTTNWFQLNCIFLLFALRMCE